MTRLNVVSRGLDSLPPPEIIDTLDFQTIRQSLVDRYLALDDAATQVLESDPIGKLIDVVAYQSLLLRQRVNDGVQAVLTGEASETELNYLGARFNVQRQVVAPGNPLAVPPILPTPEPLQRFRERIQLALDGYSTAGPEGAYRFHALDASPHIKDVSVDAPEFEHADLAPELEAQLPPDVIVLKCTHDAGLLQPMPGDVALTLLSADGDGTTSAALGNTVLDNLDDKMPLSDRPRLRAENIIHYSVEAVLEIPPGPDAETIRQAAQTAVQEYVLLQHRLGQHVRLGMLNKFLYQSGVDNVRIASPVADIVCASHHAPWCNLVNITYEVLS